jgi:thiamine-monophosphate kinase
VEDWRDGEDWGKIPAADASDEHPMEREFHAWLASRLPASARVRVGVGDDAAILRWLEAQDVVVTTDAVTDQVDFRLPEIEPRQAGHKALGVNLSDLAAMAATPVAALVSLVLPRAGAGSRSAFDLAVELYEGMLPLAERFNLDIVGGDTNSWDGPLVISVTVIGRTTARGPLRRRGARVGDALLVTGSLGGSILGRHLQVTPRVVEALRLHENYELHAGIDISDGLALDASRLAEASGCGAALRLGSIPISPDAERLAASTGRTPVEHALGDGEDFELLFAAPREAAEAMVRDQSLGVSITKIGVVVERPGLWQFTDEDELHPLEPSGYEH